MIITANAKINLSLDVLGKRNDGFHELDMVVQEIDLCDIIEIHKINEDKIYLTNDSGLPDGIENDVYKAVKYTKEFYNIKSGFRINLSKKIPIASGLGGGSADAASVILSILEIENIKINYSELDRIALKIGTEVIYCLRGGCARVRGKGDVIEPLYFNGGFDILLVNPNFKISTAKVYLSLNELDYNKNGNTSRVVRSIEEKNLEKIYFYMNNDLQKKVIVDKPEILTIIEDMKRIGAKKAMMSGSGPTVFGVFEDKNLIEKAETFFMNKGYKVFIAKTVGGKK